MASATAAAARAAAAAPAALAFAPGPGAAAAEAATLVGGTAERVVRSAGAFASQAATSLHAGQVRAARARRPAARMSGASRGSAGGAPQRICSPCRARDGGTGSRARQVPVQPLVSLINDLAATGSATAAALPQPGPRPPLPPGAASLLATGVPARRAPGEDPYPGGAQNSGSAAGDAALAPVNLSQAAAGSGGPANAFSWQEGRKRAR